MKATKSFQKKLDWKKSIDRQKVNTHLKYLLEDIHSGLVSWDVPYQRDFVWSEDQKRSFVEAVFKDRANLDIIVLDNGLKVERETGVAYEILDGKQRLSTLDSFIKNEFTIFGGYYFKDLLPEDQRFLLKLNILKNVMRKFNGKVISDKEKIQMFLDFNDTGTRVSEEHLEKLRKEVY